MAANEAICKDMLDADLTAAILRLIDGAGVLRRSIGNGRLVTCEEPGTANAGRVPGSSGRVILRTHQPSDPDPELKPESKFSLLTIIGPGVVTGPRMTRNSRDEQSLQGFPPRHLDGRKSGYIREEAEAQPLQDADVLLVVEEGRTHDADNPEQKHVQQVQGLQ